MSLTIWSNSPELAAKLYPDAVISQDVQPVDNAYDLILLDHFIQQVPREKVANTLEFFKRKLKDGGQFIVTVPSLEWACRRIATENDAPVMAYLHLYGTREEPHLCGLTLHWLRLVCEAAGFFTVKAQSEKYLVNVNEGDEEAFQNVYMGIKRGVPTSDA